MTRCVHSVARIACPTTILRGERSKVLSDEAAASFAAEIGGADWQSHPRRRPHHPVQQSTGLGRRGPRTSWSAWDEGRDDVHPTALG